MKKEQVKGCGSVNRPTPGSQWPAEPATSGFLQGVNFAIFRGRFGGLGVKLGVVDDRFSQCRAILHGVTIGVAAIFGRFFASRAAGNFPARIAADEGENYPVFLCPYPAGPPQKLRWCKQRKGAKKYLRLAVKVKPPKEWKIFLRPVRNIGVDIGQPSGVVLVVKKGGSEMPQKRINHQRQCLSPHGWPLAKRHLVL